MHVKHENADSADDEIEIEIDFHAIKFTKIREQFYFAIVFYSFHSTLLHT